MKSKRGWLESITESGSSYSVEVETEDYNKGYLTLNLADCNRVIHWHFGTPGSKRAVRKIKKIKALIDEIYDYLVPEDKR